MKKTNKTNKISKSTHLCSNISHGTTLANALLHFVCCGLPAILALLSSVLGVSSYNVNFISPATRTWLLVLGGILLATSIYFYKKESCCKNCGDLVWKKRILIISGILLAIGLIFHVSSLYFSSGHACH
mgnify:CR=1 FL=1|jgi:hypothetical protein